MIHLVTDTTAYLPPAMLERWHIHVVPLKVSIGNQSIDEDKISPEIFYKELEQVERAPTTSQPTPGEFIRLYEQLVQNGDEVLSIHISEGLSGTSRVAQIAAQEVAPDRITVVDSQVTTGALALVLQATAQALEQGASRAAAVSLIHQILQNYSAIFMVENLDYLVKGGRINGAAKFLGAMLNVRPILYLNEGKIEGLTLARTRRRGLQRIIKETRKRVGTVPIHAAITHILCPEDAAAFAEQVQQNFECASFFIHETGPVIGSHVGPGFIGLAACPVEM